MTEINPFTERGRITDPRHFAGRWGELSLIFDRLEARQPVLMVGTPGIGKSSLLTHVMQSASTAMDLQSLRAYYVNLATLPDAAEAFRVVIAALRERGNTAAALEVALVALESPVLLCLDDADFAIAAGWGERFLEDLARMVRGGQLMVVAALDAPAPQLSERFATLGLGALAAPEVRLVIDAYLDESGVRFSPGEIRELTALSAQHPAYLQRAAYYLFESKLHPGFDWRAAYLEEARERPIPGAPLPPQVFSGAQEGRFTESAYGEDDSEAGVNVPEMAVSLDTSGLFVLLVPLVVGLLIYLLLSSLVWSVVGAMLALVLAVVVARRQA